MRRQQQVVPLMLLASAAVMGALVFKGAAIWLYGLAIGLTLAALWLVIR